MNENQKLAYTLAVEVKRADGSMKEVRYITHENGKSAEFLPNRLYLYLLNRGYIKSESHQIPILLGRRHAVQGG